MAFGGCCVGGCCLFLVVGFWDRSVVDPEAMAKLGIRDDSFDRSDEDLAEGMTGSIRGLCTGAVGLFDVGEVENTPD